MKDKTTAFNKPFLCGFKRAVIILGASPIAQLLKNPPTSRRPSLIPESGRSAGRRDTLPTPVFFGFPFGSAGKESACNVGDLGSIPGLGRSPGEGKSYPLHYSGLENSINRIVHRVTKSRIQLSNLHLLY